ncbi:MAG: 16S rRNA (cytosine(1402)-N(4))-methyltransferase RsmH [Treponema sp.]|jgi:16S rRNA (cytosine1402-N4)-methyltransferase|nr:16S rRNA (cytosine(1402)-N(4))-methyltransferase RsmH [Treponema sp.]
MDFVHTPVLLEETIRYLAPRSAGELMVDATMGEGGHSYAFLSRFPDLELIGIDADGVIQDRAKERLGEFGSRVHFYTDWSQSFFAGYPAGLRRPDTILADLGVSLFHYERSRRGFSFRKDEELDMRLDTSSGLSAAELLARLPEKELADLLYNNAGERYSRRIARTIVERRRHGAVKSSAALAELIEGAVPVSYRRRPMHPATKSFQALRAAVNGDLSRLPDLLEGALRILKPGGRLGIISFNSLEDKIIKNFFREKNRNCTCPPEEPICKCKGRRSVNILTRKGIVPGSAETEQNPRSRSARLRVAEKVLDEDGQ